jgi:ABC-type nitrate/sulfonate/bicarbonate transport system permease component
MRWPAPTTARWLILAALLAFWELMPRTKLIPELFLPSLSKTLAVLYSDWHDYVAALGVTIYEVAFAMLFACGVGILAGALVGGLALLRTLLYRCSRAFMRCQSLFSTRFSRHGSGSAPNRRSLSLESTASSR